METTTKLIRTAADRRRNLQGEYNVVQYDLLMSNEPLPTGHYRSNALVIGVLHDHRRAGSSTYFNPHTERESRIRGEEVLSASCLLDGTFGIRPRFGTWTFFPSDQFDEFVAEVEKALKSYKVAA
jgi:hypothetical protein